MEFTLSQNIARLKDQELLDLSKELAQLTVPEDALIRKVIKGTEFDTTAPGIAFVAVGQVLQFELARRFAAALKILNLTRLDVTP